MKTTYAFAAAVQVALAATPAFAQEVPDTEARYVAIMVLPKKPSAAVLAENLVANDIIGSVDPAMMERGVIMGELNPSLHAPSVIMGELNPWLVASGIIPGALNPRLDGGVIMGELNPVLADGVIMGEYDPEGTPLWLDQGVLEEGVIMGECTPQGGITIGAFDARLLAGGVIMGEYDPDISEGVIMGEYDPEAAEDGVIMGEFNPPLDFGVGVSPPGINFLGISNEHVHGVIMGEYDPESGTVSNLRVELQVRRKFLMPALGE